MAKFIFWDVQHGAACYIRDDKRRNIIVDLGNGISRNGHNFSPIGILRAQGVLDELHLLIVTHPHEDHIIDLPALNGIPIRSLIAPEDLPDNLLSSNTEAMLEYRRLVAAYQYDPPFRLREKQEQRWQGIEISVFRPTCHGANLNDRSLVVLFDCNGVGVMICGDNESSSWESLLNQESFTKSLRKVDIFAAPHHGRESGFYQPLFDMLSPKLTIISDGPVLETDVAPRYGSVSKGMKVHYKNGGSEMRKCVTTRCDGAIYIEIEDTFWPTTRVTLEKGTRSSARRI